MCPVIKLYRLYKLARYIIDLCNFGIKKDYFHGAFRDITSFALLSEHPRMSLFFQYVNLL